MLITIVRILPQFLLNANPIMQSMGRLCHIIWKPIKIYFEKDGIVGNLGDVRIVENAQADPHN